MREDNLGMSVRKKIRISFHRALTILLALVIFVPCYGVILLMFSNIQNDISEEFIQSQQQVLYQTSRVLSTIVDNINASTAYVFLNTELMRTVRIANNDDETKLLFAKESLRKFLSNIFTTMSAINPTISLTLLDGTIITPSAYLTLNKPATEYDWFADVSAANGTSVWRRELEDLHDKLGLTNCVTSSRILLSGNANPLGILTVSLQDDLLWEKLQSEDLTQLGNIYFVASNGQIISEQIHNEDLSHRNQVDSTFAQWIADDHNGYQSFIIENQEQVFVNPIQRTDFYLIYEIDRESMLAQVKSHINKTIYLILLVFIIFLLMTVLLFRWITRPIKRLAKVIGEFGMGGFHRRAQRCIFKEIDQLSEGFNTMAFRIEQLVKDIEVQIELRKEARYQMLKAQIQPHFLFNTLNHIRWMATLNGANAVADAIVQLGTILSSTLGSTSQNDTSLHNEINVLLAYVQLQKMRYGNQFTFSLDVPDELINCAVPKFILQPIIENAIIHGIPSNVHGEIRLEAYREEDDLIVKIQDNGKGVPQNVLVSLLEDDVPSDVMDKKVSGLGIKNIHLRLRLLFGECYGLTLISEESKGFTTLIRLPLVELQEEEQPS